MRLRLWLVETRDAASVVIARMKYSRKILHQWLPDTDSHLVVVLCCCLKQRYSPNSPPALSENWPHYYVHENWLAFLCFTCTFFLFNSILVKYLFSIHFRCGMRFFVVHCKFNFACLTYSLMQIEIVFNELMNSKTMFMLFHMILYECGVLSLAYVRSVFLCVRAPYVWKCSYDL